MKLEERRISKTAIVVTSLYLLTVVASLIITLMTKDDTPMSGIFLIMVTMPWGAVLPWIQEVLHFDSMTANTLFLVAGGLLNSAILFKLTLLLMGWSKQ